MTCKLILKIVDHEWDSADELGDLYGECRIRRKLTKELRTLVTKMAESDVDHHALAAEALLLLDQLEAAEPTSTRGTAEVEYVVEESVNGLVLTEKRKTGRAHPFRCPKAVYDAVGEALSKADVALSLEELMKVAGALLGDQPPDFQTRVPLRLWLFVDPPLIVRNRARYRPVDPTTFATSANDLWIALQT